jgi:membrane-associated phospholipid phosphatase
MLVWPNGWAHPSTGHYIAMAVFAALITLGFVLPSPAMRVRGGVLFDALVRRFLRIRTASGRKRAARVSDVLLWTLSSWAVLDALVVAGLVHRHGDVAAHLVTMDALSLGVTGSIVMLTKKIIGRERPHVTPETERHPEDNLSFFGGHAAMTFTGAGLVFLQHRHLPLYGGGTRELVVGTIALSLAAVTALLRVAADKHYLSDVLVGSAIGVVSGLIVPLIVFT